MSAKGGGGPGALRIVPLSPCKYRTSGLLCEVVQDLAFQARINSECFFRRETHEPWRRTETGPWLYLELRPACSETPQLDTETGHRDPETQKTPSTITWATCLVVVEPEKCVDVVRAPDASTKDRTVSECLPQAGREKLFY